MTSAIRHIAFLAIGYPSPVYPYAGVFLKELVETIARTGVKCTVIHPEQIHHWKSWGNTGASSPAQSASESPVRVVRPWYLSLSRRRIGPFRTSRATQYFYERAAWRVVRRFEEPPEMLYGHFLYPAGAAAVSIGKRMGIPSFVAVGEGSFWTVRPMGFERARRDYRDVTGIVAVSSLLKKKLIAEIQVPAEKIEVFPNGVDRTRFFPRPREEMRAKYGLPKDRFLVAFVGAFIHDKGSLRLAKAIEGLDGVGGLFAGAGPRAPSGRNVLFCGGLPHQAVPEILSAADAFVLPTLVEGSCNAIVEAMACGLPIVTSEGEFNDDLVDQTVSIRVDPMDVSAIREAIVTLRDDDALRGRMAAAALARAEQFDIDRRAERICSFMAARL